MFHLFPECPHPLEFATSGREAVFVAGHGFSEGNDIPLNGGQIPVKGLGDSGHGFGREERCATEERHNESIHNTNHSPNRRQPGARTARTRKFGSCFAISKKPYLSIKKD